MLVNKCCPFCKIVMRKSYDYTFMDYKIHCFRCKNNFREISEVFYFNLNNCDVIIDESSMIINSNNNSYKIDYCFDVYNNFKEVIDKFQTVTIFQ